MKINIIFFQLLLVGAAFYYPQLFAFSYDKAAYAAQQGKWNEAHQKLHTLLVDNPDDADLLYDAGVAAHTIGNAAQAATCFSRAAQYAHDNDLRIRAYYNAGNAYVAHKNLPAALTHYEKVLAIDPSHEYARHNYERVKQMLEEEQKKNDQKQDQQKNDERSDKDKQDHNDDKQSSDDDQQEDQKDQQGGNDQPDQQNGQQEQDGNAQGDKQKKDSSQRDQQQSDQGSEGDQEQEADRGSRDAERKQHGNNKKEQKKESTDKQERNGDQDFDQQSKNDNAQGDKEQTDKQTNTPEKENKDINNNNVSSARGQDQAENGDLRDAIEQKIDNPFLMKVLEEQEMRDKAMNKQLMSAKIRQSGGGSNGQNCW